MRAFAWPVAVAFALALAPTPAGALDPLAQGSVEGDLVTIYLRITAQGNLGTESTPDGFDCNLDVGYSSPLSWEATCKLPAGFHCGDPTITMSALAVAAAGGSVRCNSSFTPPVAGCSLGDLDAPAALVYGVCTASASGSSPGFMGCAGKAPIVTTYVEIECVFRLVPA